MESKILLAFLMVTVVLGGAKFVKKPGYDSRSYQMPPICKNQRYCARKGPSYPTEVVDMVLSQQPHLEVQQRIAEVNKDYESRVLDSPNASECFTKEIHFKPLYYILDEKNNTRVVIQSERFEFHQFYQIRSCKKEGRVFKTVHFRNSTLAHYNMTCQDIKYKLDFQVLKLDKLEIELIYVDMPVFCKAAYSKLV